MITNQMTKGNYTVKIKNDHGTFRVMAIYNDGSRFGKVCNFPKPASYATAANAKRGAVKMLAKI